MSAIVWYDVDALNVAIAHHRVLLTGQLDEERHRHDVGERLTVDAFERFAWAEADTVVAGYDDQGLVVESFGFQPAGDMSDDRVHVLQLQQVLSVGLDDGPRLANPAAAALQTIEHRILGELLARAQVDIRFVRQQRMQEVERRLRIRSADAFDESARTVTPIRVARADPAHLPVLALDEVLPILGQRRQQRTKVPRQDGVQVDDGRIEHLDRKTLRDRRRFAAAEALRTQMRDRLDHFVAIRSAERGEQIRRVVVRRGQP